MLICHTAPLHFGPRIIEEEEEDPYYDVRGPAPRYTIYEPPPTYSLEAASTDAEKRQFVARVWNGLSALFRSFRRPPTYMIVNKTHGTALTEISRVLRCSNPLVSFTPYSIGISTCVGRPIVEVDFMNTTRSKSRLDGPLKIYGSLYASKSLRLRGDCEVVQSITVRGHMRSNGNMICQ